MNYLDSTDPLPLSPLQSEHMLSGRSFRETSSSRKKWVVDGILGQHDVFLLTGQEKISRKTMLMCDLAITRVLGGRWLGHDVTRQSPRARILILEAETSADQMSSRIEALCRGRGLSEAEIDYVFARVTLCPKAISLLPAADRVQNADNSKWHPHPVGRHLDLLEDIEASPVGMWSLIIVDSLANSFVGNENSSEDANRFNRALRDLARAFSCPVGVLHHTSKQGVDPRNARSARGSGELTAGVDLVVSIEAKLDKSIMRFITRDMPVDPIEFRFDGNVDGSTDEKPIFRFESESISPVCDKAGKCKYDDQIEVILKSGPLVVTAIRERLGKLNGASKANKNTVESALARLISQHVVEQVDKKYHLVQE